MSNNNNEYISGKRNVLVTGGAGFIGSHLCEELVKDSHVLCLDNYLTGSQSNIDHLIQLPDFEFIKHDIIEPIDLGKSREAAKFKVKFQGIQEIYHAACPTSPKQFDKFRIETLLANAYGTKNALDLAVKHKAKFVLFSTASIYGEPQNQAPFKEDYWGFIDPIGVRSCYNEGKRFAESLVVNYREKYGIDAKIVRIFNTYGPRMRLEDGRLIPDFVSQALAGKPIEIYSKGEATTTLCYVGDLINGLIKMMRSDEVGPINLGNDEAIKIIDVAQKIIELTNSKSTITSVEPSLHIARQGVPDITLAKNKLEWFPLTSLEDGLKKTIEMMRLSKRRVAF